MSTFYSILYVPIRPAQEEKVSIALFLNYEGKTYFKYSLPKLHIIKPLLPTAAFGLLKSYLKNMAREIGEGTLPESERNSPLSTNRNISYFEESYFDYLSKYSNNLLSFSKPKNLKLPVNEKTFGKLFKKYIFREEEATISDSRPALLHEVRKNLFPTIKHHVNIDRHLTSQDIPNLFIPTDVNFIGKNDLPVAGHTFNFEKRLYNLEHDVASFVGLAKAFELNGEKNGQFFVIGNEPPKKDNPGQHKTWKTIYDSNFMEFVPVAEIEKISDYLKNHKVRPYFKQD